MSRVHAAKDTKGTLISKRIKTPRDLFRSGRECEQTGARAGGLAQVSSVIEQSPALPSCLRDLNRDVTPADNRPICRCFLPRNCTLGDNIEQGSDDAIVVGIDSKQVAPSLDPLLVIDWRNTA